MENEQIEHLNEHDITENSLNHNSDEFTTKKHMHQTEMPKKIEIVDHDDEDDDGFFDQNKDVSIDLEVKE